MPLQMDVIKAVKEMNGGDMEKVRRFIADYYRTGPGKREQADSPNAKKSLVEHAERVYQNFVDWDR